MKWKAALTGTAAIIAALVVQTAFAKGPDKILNVSYDVSRELFAQLNPKFAEAWKAKTGQAITTDQSHGGSSSQARAILEGLEADVVTFNQVTDVQVLHDKGKLIPADWQKRLPNNSSPYTSTIVFLVRKGNPKGIKDWGDLAKPGTSVITPNPKTSGGARWNYLAAWEFARRKAGGSEVRAREFVARLYANVPVLDTGARGSSVTFAQRNQGDVFISWENEAHLLEKEFGSRVDFVYPSLSILAEPAVTIVDRNVDRRGTRAVAQAYLEFLYTEEGQDLAGKHFYRPVSPKAQARYARQFPKLELFTIEQAFGGWAQATRTHFVDGAIFDQIYTVR
jgi:sulfate transport system substrate-binding protein